MEEQQPDRRWIVLAAFAAVAAIVVAAVLIGQSGGSDDGTTAAAGDDASAGGCTKVEAPKPKTVSFKAPKQVLEKGETATAVVKTSCGSFEIALDTDRAAETANSFAFLAEEGFYDDLTFHRI
ncbi:MAG TPA: peptidylprolyl isomerase, partial [Solirubrobacterales bacterium]|nr:peptidylprolyl isomerase [Solirubrobacterales bacterium]